MTNLTSDQIGLIRIAITEKIKDGFKTHEYADMLSILEFGCGVKVTSCDERSEQLLDTCSFPGCDEKTAQRSDLYCRQCIKIQPVGAVKGPQA